MSAMNLDGARTEPKPVGGFLSTTAVGNELRDLALTLGKRVRIRPGHVFALPKLAFSFRQREEARGQHRGRSEWLKTAVLAARPGYDP